MPHRTSPSGRVDPDASALAFRLGHLDAVERAFLPSPALYSADLRAVLALRWLRRIWTQYRKDRAISDGAALIGAECAAARNAFLALLETILLPQNHGLGDAIRVVRRLAIRPLSAEAAQTADIIAESIPILSDICEALAAPNLPPTPVARLSALVAAKRYSTLIDGDALTATAFTPCWAINLVAAARSRDFHLANITVPLPGLVERRMFRADMGLSQLRSEVHEALLHAVHETICDIVIVPRAEQAFHQTFPRLRSHSRASTAWHLLFALGALTPAQLARALPATKAGAAKLLRQLVGGQLAHHDGAYAPYTAAVTFPFALSGWASANGEPTLLAVDEDDLVGD